MTKKRLLDPLHQAIKEKSKIEASKKRILKCCERAHYMGAGPVVFHPGYYGGMDKEETYQNIKKVIIDLQKEIERINKQYDSISEQIEKSEKKLSSPFSQRASPEVVQKEKDNLNEQILALNNDLESDVEFSRLYFKAIEEYSKGMFNEGFARAYYVEADYCYQYNLFNWCEIYYNYCSNIHF